MDTISVFSSGKLVWRNKQYKCALGRGGVKKNKQEGDNGTPAGCYPLRMLYYRADRISKPETRLPVKKLTKRDAWCDDSADKNYNKFVSLPYRGHTESLWRDDNLYDIIVPLGYNDAPAVPGKGSAIFMHIARPGYTPTAGCIALTQPDLLEILSSVEKDAKVQIS
jgi:L,D-peptidoglycan transpeptidase YkuD (ErfK/YbiS/YcfS/YnhG family)